MPKRQTKQAPTETYRATSMVIDGSMSLRHDLWERAGIQDGQLMDVEVSSQGIFIHPAQPSSEPEPDRAWFDTPEGQARLEAAFEAKRQGKPWIFSSGTEFIVFLERFAPPDTDIR